MIPAVNQDNCTGSCTSCSAVGSCADRVVCRCLKVTETDVIAAIRDGGATSLVELQMLTEAGTGCTCCHRELRNYLAIYSSSSSARHLLGQVVLQADRRDQPQLRLQPVDVLLGLRRGFRAPARACRCP